MSQEAEQILLVGEGKTELGEEVWDERKKERRQKKGVGQILCSRLLAATGKEVVFIAQDIHHLRKVRLPRKPLREIPPLKGQGRQAYRAMLQVLFHDYRGLIIFVDNDHDPGDRRQELQNGIDAARDKDTSLQEVPAAAGVAKEMIEAWILADPLAFEKVWGHQRCALPHGRGPEELWGEKGRPESNRPKELLARLLKEDYHQEANLYTFQELAEAIDLDVLEVECPIGFGQLAQAIRDEFGVEPVR